MALVHRTPGQRPGLPTPASEARGFDWGRIMFCFVSDQRPAQRPGQLSTGEFTPSPVGMKASTSPRLAPGKRCWAGRAEQPQGPPRGWTDTSDVASLAGGQGTLAEHPRASASALAKQGQSSNLRGLEEHHMTSQR